MKMNMYYRLLLSYAPIFFVVISILMFVFFSILNTTVKNQILETNKIMSNQVVHSLDANLEMTERTLIREIMGNQSVKLFFKDQPKTMYDYFHISHQLDEISNSIPFINSIYLYNETTGQVLSRNDLIQAKDFSDYSFIKSIYESNDLHGTWTNPREFIRNNSSERVISLAKFYPLPVHSKGMIVVNISVDSLLEFVNKLNDNHLISIKLFDTKHVPFSAEGLSSSSIQTDEIDSTYFSEKSNYTGWHFQTGIKKAYGFSVLSSLTNVSVISGILTIIIGIIWLGYTSYRNYKPIQSIISRIHNAKSEQFGIKGHDNEYKIIQETLENLMEKSSQYEKLHKDDFNLRKRHFLMELLEGNAMLSEEEWQVEFEKYKIPFMNKRLVVVIIELDNYIQLTTNIDSSEQFLHKFVVQNVFEEISEKNGTASWSDWTSTKQLTSILFLNESDYPNQAIIMHICNSLREWIHANLNFTVSIGVGEEIYKINDIYYSNEIAKEHISYKPIFGNNQTIGYWNVKTKKTGDVLDHLQTIKKIAELFRLGEKQWKVEYFNLFQNLKEILLSKFEMNQLFDYMIFHFQKEVMELPEEVHIYWKRNTLPLLVDILEKTDTMEKLNDDMYETFNKLEMYIEDFRKQRSNSVLIFQVTEYIKQNYQNPDLSLNLVSDQFGMNPRYLSRIFKEELGDNFLNYLIKLRISHAKQLLSETDLTIQEISEQVGYIHAMSFIRSFKKINGYTPGVFRSKIIVQ